MNGINAIEARTERQTHTHKPNPFQSFWMAGYECTDKLNAFGNRVDFLTTTGHLQTIESDYRNLKQFNLQTVREGIRWSFVEKKPYEYDWSIVKRMIETARLLNIQQVWDLCHFGFPDDLSPLHPMFARRFASLCRSFVKFYRSIEPDKTLIVTPINEVSFLSWLGGEVRGTSPFCVRMGWEVKYALMRAYIEGVAAIFEVDPTVRILTTDPLVNIVAPLDAPYYEQAISDEFHEVQYQAIDILSGRICPELGGSPAYLDIIGLNYYYDNQWVHPGNEVLPWANDFNDPRFRPLRSLLKEAYNRYGKPIVITETGHSGEHRPNWLESITKESESVLNDGIPLWGICLYPIIDRPDWDHFHPWHGCGLWDFDPLETGMHKRILYEPLAKELIKSQQRLGQYPQAGINPTPPLVTQPQIQY